MNAPIHENHGFIDKFIGDAIMALFDQPDLSDTEEAENAVRAAIGMQRALESYNLDKDKLIQVPIEAGIGLHSGGVIIGTVGSEDRMDSTILGDNVNLASRLEGLTKYYGAKIIISSATLELLEDPSRYCIRFLDRVSVKGKSEPIDIYELYDFEGPQAMALKDTNKALLDRAMAHRRQKEWDQARELLEDLSRSEPTLGAVLLEHLEKLERSQLPEDWSGAYAMDHK